MAHIYMVCHILKNGNAGFPTEVFVSEEDAKEAVTRLHEISTRNYVVEKRVVTPASRDLAQSNYIYDHSEHESDLAINANPDLYMND